MWADFSTTDKGGDLVSLYAAINGLKQGDAARQLSELANHPLKPNGTPHPAIKPKAETLHKLTQRIPTTPPPEMVHPTHGVPSAHWVYEGPTGGRSFYVARYDTPSGKQVVPWSWCSTHSKWEARGWPAPRPLFNLPELTARPDAPVLLVEGEKAAVAARTIAGKVYVVMTWPNGAKAVSKADWAPLYGRKLILWPDADKAGTDAMAEISALLKPHCPEIKLLDVSGLPDGWDAADALSDGPNRLPDWSAFAKWAKPRVSTVASAPAKPVSVAEVLGPIPPADPPSATVDVTVHKDTTPERSHYEEWEALGLERTNGGQPIMNMDNVSTIFQKHPDLADFVWYDEFHQRMFTTWRSLDGKRREWTDVDTLEMTLYLQRERKLAKVSDELVYKAVQLHAQKHVRNEPKDWMDTLVWDGVERLEHFFFSCFGAPDTDYVRAASRNFWLSIAARVYHAGCQQDHMVVLEGAQGVGKTKALRLIGGPWYVEANESVTTKDFFMLLPGKLIIEIAELDAFSKAEVTRIKQVITCTIDRYRKPYGRGADDHPRRCVFVGSTNETTYLRDMTGSRRFWPIHTTAIDHAAISELRDLLYAEAAARVKRAEPWYLMPASQTADEQEARRQSDEWESIIADFINPGMVELRLAEVADKAIGLDPSKLDLLTQRRIGSILHRLGWVKRNLRRGGGQVKLWVRVGATLLDG